MEAWEENDYTPDFEKRRAESAAERSSAEPSAGAEQPFDDPVSPLDDQPSTKGAASGATACPPAGDEEERPRRKFFAGDRVLWIIIATLAIISVLVVYSSTAKMAYGSNVRTTAEFLRQQIFLLAMSFGVLLLALNIDSRIYNRYAKAFYVMSMLLTLATYFMGVSTNSAARWISILGFQFQPSEMLKVATVIFLARQLSCRQSKMNKIKIIPTLKIWRWSEPRNLKIWEEGTKPILMPVVLAATVIFPAHTSSALLVLMVAWVMMLIARVKLGELLKLVGLAVIGALMIYTLNLGRSETAEGRVATWINLWTTSQVEKPIQHLSDTERSMIAIHNGGILGEGAGQSTIRAEMTHPESDYAFAFFVEEYGLVFATVLMVLYLWIFFRAREIFEECGTAFPGLLVLGLAVMITIQAMLHIMVTVNLSPETGQTLPIISRGGSSMIFTAMALGMILSVSRQNSEGSHDKPKGESIYGR